MCVIMCISNFCRHLKMCHDPNNDKSSYIANDDLEPLLRKNGENVTINVRCKESIMHTYDNLNHDDSCSFELLAPLCRQLGYSDLRVCSNSLNTHWFTNFGWTPKYACWRMFEKGCNSSILLLCRC